MTTAEQVNRMIGRRSDYAGVFLYNEIEPWIKRHGTQNKAFIINYIDDTPKEIKMMGHYIVLNFRKKDAFYFDPYGIATPDKPRDILGLPNPHTLTKLLNEYGGDWKANKTDFQAWIHGDSTCGQYCAMYVVQPDLSKPPWVGRPPQPFTDLAVSLMGDILTH